MTNTRPADRIQELVRAIIDERMRDYRESEECARDREMAGFLGKLMGGGFGDADFAERIMKEPMTWIAAIVAYLEESKP